MTLSQSPLHDQHLALGAKLAEFGGWQMPLEYAGSGVLKEHTAVREAVGLFDVSHLGKLAVSGPGALEHLNASLTNDLRRIGPGRAQYTLVCDDAHGGVVDDLIAYVRAEDDVLLVPNAANTAEVRRRLVESAPNGVDIADQHHTHAVLAVQGPRCDEVLTAVGLPAGHDYMSFVEVSHGGHPVVVCRSGYTGERGYELVVPAEGAVALWQALLDAGQGVGLLPCGLGARDTLRTEMGYPLHGQDIGPEITPVQARLGWAVGWDKPAFWGRTALVSEKTAGPSRLLRGLVARGRGIPRPGMPVRFDGETVGHVTSGTFSPTLRTGIALALLDAAVGEGQQVEVDVRQRTEPFEVTRPPFVQQRGTP